VATAAALAVVAAAPAAAMGDAAAATPASVTLSTTEVPAEGGTITVSGTGFDPAAHVGTRPPLAGQPSGVYVVFGRFADTWQPSAGAPSSSRQVITQVWALPQAQHDVLDPTGANPEIVLLSPDGTFTAQVAAKPAAGTGTYGLATYAASGAVNAAQETFTAVTLGAAPTTTTTTTTTTTAPTTTTTAPTTTTTAPTTTTTAPTPAPDGPAASATGPRGQTLTVAPATGLAPSGAEVDVTGSGYDPELGIYVALCVDQGPGTAPSPCLGGATVEGGTGSSAWISSDPPPYAVGLAEPFGTGGTFAVRLRLTAADQFVDCLAEGTRCVLSTRADHTAGGDRSADVKVPVRFAGQDPAPEPPRSAPTATVSPTTVAAGGRVDVSATGLLGGEQVQVRLTSTGAVLATTNAGADGTVQVAVVVPAGTSPGRHRLEVAGITSGTKVTTGDIDVTAAPLAVPASVAGASTAGGSSAAASAGSGATSASSAATPQATSLARTGGSIAPAGAGLALLAAGLVLLTVRSRRPLGARLREETR
jgi:hypothetical protein